MSVRMTQNPALHKPGSFLCFLFLNVLLTGCAAINTGISSASLETPSPASVASAVPAASTQAQDCPVTEPVWAKPPDDPAVQGSPGYGYYYINEDRSIWASAWWTEKEADALRSGDEGNKVGWFRPAGVDLEIAGQRIDATAPALEVSIPCCYPTRFQATGLTFPTEGCWKVTARAADRVLTFVVPVTP